MNHYGVLSIKIMRDFNFLLDKLEIDSADWSLVNCKEFVNRLDKERTHQTMNARVYRMGVTKKFLNTLNHLGMPSGRELYPYLSQHVPVHRFVVRMEVLDPETTATTARLLGVGIVKHKSLTI